MKKIILAFLLLTATYKLSAQKDSYVTSGLELIFSWAEITQNNTGQSPGFRFAPVINIQSMYHVDFSPKFGVYTGLAVRNVGYIYPSYPIVSTTPSGTVNATLEKRFRSYNLGVPLAFKLGNLKKSFIYGGYEFELPFVYKEKTYENDDKKKIVEWFSSRQQSFYHSVLVGIQFPYGMNLKFKYYLTEFHNQNYANSDGTKPYAGLQSNVFYISLNSYLFKNDEVYYKETE